MRQPRLTLADIMKKQDALERIKASALLEVLCEQCQLARQDHDETTALFCAVYALALLEAWGSDAFQRVEFDEIRINKAEYEMILNQMERRQKDFKRFAYRNAAISVCLALVIFIALRCFFHAPLGLALPFAAVIFLLDLFLNGKTNEKRYQQRWLRQAERAVDHRLIALCQHYLK